MNTPKRNSPPAPAPGRAFTVYRLERAGRELALAGTAGTAREEGNSIVVFLFDGSRLLLRPQIDRDEDMPEPFELELVAPASSPRTFRP
jgi:hypothetical protein